MVIKIKFWNELKLKDFDLQYTFKPKAFKVDDIVGIRGEQLQHRVRLDSKRTYFNEDFLSVFGDQAVTLRIIIVWYHFKWHIEFYCNQY